MRGDGRMHVGLAPTVELRMPPRPENLALARLALAGVGSLAGASDGEIADLKLAVTEACTNAIEHAYAGDPASNEIVVRFALDDGALSVEVQDWGTGFDTEIEPPPDEELRDRAGVGLMLIRSLTDELTIESGGAGSTISFAKRLRPQE